MSVRLMKLCKDAMNVGPIGLAPRGEADTPRWTGIYGNTIFLPRVPKRISIAAERRIPWIGRQYLHAAHVVPTGCVHVTAGD